MSHVYRLQDADRIFFVTVNLRPALAPFGPGEYAKLIAAIEASRAKLGFKLLGYVLDPSAVKRCVIAVDYVMLPETYRG